MTHRERIWAAVVGEMPDVLPYVPRIDLWYNANSMAETLPKRHQGRSQDEISQAEGWALFKMLPDMLDLRGSEDIIHRAIGVHPTRHYPYRVEFPTDVEIKVSRDKINTRVEYHTPLGIISTATTFPEELKKAGSTYPVVKEHAIKGPEDYDRLAYIFSNLKIIPDSADFVEWEKGVGEDGFCCATASLAASPMHHIQRDFLDPTSFFLHYEDYQSEMRNLAEALEIYYNQLLKVMVDSPARGVCWGCNYDDMITYAPFFEKEIMPWLQKAGDALRAKGKIIDCHCDGENKGLMDLIKASRIDVAEAVCPYPMTKVNISDYYKCWSQTTTIFGGIPSNILLDELTSDEEFENYLDCLFKAIAPGYRFVVGIADTTPPDANFERLVRIGERVEKEGRLPLQAGSFDPISNEQLQQSAAIAGPKTTKILPGAIQSPNANTTAKKFFETLHQLVLAGKDKEIGEEVRSALKKGLSPKDIMNYGLLTAMDVIGSRFTEGTVFIPEVILSARAMNAAISVLGPHLAKEDKTTTIKILIGTVKGDLHDIGKNLVLTMMRGSGLEAIDLGIDVPVETFIDQVQKHRPNVLGLSALLTTTMPEMRHVINALIEAGLRDKVKVIVGGAPVNERYAADIGADGYAKDAGEAVAWVKQSIEIL